MKRDLFVADIDGFIYDTSERAYLSSLKMGLNISRLDASGVDPRNPKFRYIDFDRYYDIFDRPDHAETDVPMPYAGHVLRSLRSKGLEIAYVSVRPQGEKKGMEKGNKKCFKRDGFPDPDEDSGAHLILRPPYVTGHDGRKTKKLLVYILTKAFSVVAGGGDTPGDSRAYLDNGIPALIVPSFQFGFGKDDFLEETVFLPDIVEVKNFVEKNILDKRAH